MKTLNTFENGMIGSGIEEMWCKKNHGSLNSETLTEAKQKFGTSGAWVMCGIKSREVDV